MTKTALVTGGSSGDGPYRERVKKIEAFMENYFKQNSEPKVIANVVLEAVTSKPPKTRYAADNGARMGLFMRRLLSDRMCDGLIKGMVG